MQWADASLLDFIEHLLEWSRTLPLFVVTLARPELQERRPGWGAASRNFTSIFLEPLPEDAMHGAPGGARSGPACRARGADPRACRGHPALCRRDGANAARSRCARAATAPSIGRRRRSRRSRCPRRCTRSSPRAWTVSASEERRVLQDGSVLGKTFAKQALAALSGLSESELEPILVSLTRKEVLGVQSDPRSPEHGQYGFLQDMLRRVAYETLAKTDRKKTAPCGRRVPRGVMGRARGSRGRGLPLPRRLRAGAGRSRCGRHPCARRRATRTGRRAGRVSRGQRGGRALLHAGRGAER